MRRLCWTRVLVFFFKQKTAYEMRISDWSSDVCSSDLGEASPGLTSRQALSPKQLDPPSTSHLSVVDADGNAVSMTASIEGAFGSHPMVRGFLLNNELTDFTFQPRVEGRAVANRLEHSKRPRNSITPTLCTYSYAAPPTPLGSPAGR